MACWCRRLETKVLVFLVNASVENPEALATVEVQVALSGCIADATTPMKGFKLYWPAAMSYKYTLYT